MGVNFLMSSFLEGIIIDSYIYVLRMAYKVNIIIVMIINDQLYTFNHKSIFLFYTSEISCNYYKLSKLCSVINHYNNVILFTNKYTS